MERAKSQSKPSAGAPSSYLLAQRCLSYEHYLLARAQGAVQEPGLPQLVARTTASVVRGFFNRRTADRKNGGPRYSHLRSSLASSDRADQDLGGDIQGLIQAVDHGKR